MHDENKKELDEAKVQYQEKLKQLNQREIELERRLKDVDHVRIEQDKNKADLTRKVRFYFLTHKWIHGLIRVLTTVFQFYEIQKKCF